MFGVNRIAFSAFIALVIVIGAVGCGVVPAANPTPQPAATAAPATPVAQATTPPATPAPVATATPVAPATVVATTPVPAATATSVAAANPTPTTPTAAQPTPAPTATVAAMPAEGVRLTVDGQPVRLEGQPKVELVRSSLPNMGTFDTIAIEAGRVGDQATGYGVQLVLQSQPNQSALAEGFAPEAVHAATITVWKDGQHSFVSTVRVPPQPVAGLRLPSTRGRLAGSYESTTNRGAGTFPARVEFNVPFP
jgi:hypothetical protein